MRIINFPGGDKKKLKIKNIGGRLNGELTLQSTSSTSHTSLPCLFCMSFNVSVESEEDMSFFVLLIFINTFNKMEINLES